MKLNELRAIASRRTAGNWFVEDNFDDPIVKTDAENVPDTDEYYGNNIAMLVYDGLSDWTRPSAKADAEFISCAARVFDRLLDIAEAAKEVIECNKCRELTGFHGLVELLAALEAAEGGVK